jgi:hypothetical protein
LYSIVRPKFPELIKAPVGRIARDDAGIDGADRRTNDPVRLDFGFVQGLVDAALIGAKRAATLQHQNNLARQFLRFGD